MFVSLGNANILLHLSLVQKKKKKNVCCFVLEFKFTKKKKNIRPLG